MNKFKIGDRVMVRLPYPNGVCYTDGYICKVIEILDLQNYIVEDSEGYKWCVKDNVMEHMEEPKEKETLHLNYASKYNELLIKHIDIKEENEELKELLDIAKATIQMISELI